MKSFALILFSCFIVGCSTTNRQVIVECGNSCYSSSRSSKAKVTTSMSPTNMTIRVNSPSHQTAKPSATIQTNTSKTVNTNKPTNSITSTNIISPTNSIPVVTNIPVPVVTNQAVWRDNALYEETTIALVDRYYIIQ